MASYSGSWLVVLALSSACACCAASTAGETPAGSSPQDSTGLHIAAFNIQHFGPTKYGQRKIVDILVKIVRRYDLVFIQEINDVRGSFIWQFLGDVNRAEGKEVYNMSLSEPLGLSKYKERYAYLYRMDRVRLEGVQVIPGHREQFYRPPYVALVHSLGSLPPQFPAFTVIGAHLRPQKELTIPELNALPDVYDTSTRMFAVSRSLLLGDFNAGCGYVGKRAFAALNLTRDPRFVWLINQPTSVARPCNYDRFVGAGGLEAYVKGNASVFHFDREYNLTALAIRSNQVSDHYPIEILLARPEPEIKSHVHNASGSNSSNASASAFCWTNALACTGIGVGGSLGLAGLTAVCCAGWVLCVSCLKCSWRRRKRRRMRRPAAAKDSHRRRGRVVDSCKHEQLLQSDQL